MAPDIDVMCRVTIVYICILCLSYATQAVEAMLWEPGKLADSESDCVTGVTKLDTKETFGASDALAVH